MQYYDYNQKLRIPDKLFTPLYGVRLNGGLFGRVFENGISFVKKNFEIDRMCYWYDEKAGKHPTAEPYQHNALWEGRLKGQTASLFLMEAGNALRWREDPELRAAVDEIVDRIEAAAEADGFILPIDQSGFGRIEYPHYTRIWLTYGLLAAHRAGNRRALPLLRRFQDWFNACPDLPVIRYTSLAFQGVVASPQIYFTEAGREEDMKIGRKAYEETWRLAQFIERGSDEAVSVRRQPGVEPHAHGSEIEAYEGYLDLYRYFGAPYLLNAVLGFRDAYQRSWQHVGGGIVMIETFGECNPLRPGSRYFRKTHEGKPSTYNELCASAFWLQLHQRLHRLFPDNESYVFEMEESLYNIAFANQNGDREIRYYAYLDGNKSRSDFLYHCCAGIGSRIFGSLPEYLFTMKDSTLSVDIFASGTLTWETPYGIVTVREETDFPYNGRISLRLESDAPHELTLRIRIPCYAAKEVPILLNGKIVATGKPGSYATIARIFQSGDRLDFEIPMALTAHPYDGYDRVQGYSSFSYTYGPLLMAVVGERNSEEVGIALPGDNDSFSGSLRPTGSPLHFAVGDTGYILMPYFEVQEENFTCFPFFKDI